MEENFQNCLKLVLIHEGGYVDHPRDPGGATNKGITLKVFQDFFGEDLDKDDLRELTAEQAGKIYRKNYWLRCKCDQLPDGVDYVVFDQAVNSGPGRSIKWLQAAAGVETDGAIGPITLAAVQELEASQLVKHMCEARLDFLKKLDHWDSFKNGWSSRVQEVREKAMRMSGEREPPQTIEASYDILRMGDEGPWVEQLQKALNALTALKPPLNTDGQFGPATEAALRTFQQDIGLEVDGIAGHNSLRALGLIA